MKHLLSLIIAVLVGFTVNAQATADIRTDASEPYEMKCGAPSKRLLVKLTTIQFPADSPNDAEDRLRDIHIKPFKNYYKNFPEAAKSFFDCLNDDCEKEICDKKVSNIFVDGTDPKHVGNGMYESIIYVYVTVKCRECGNPNNGMEGDPTDEDCPIEIDMECNTEFSASYKFRTKKIVAETEEEALEIIEELKDVLKDLLNESPDIPDVTVNCIPIGCEPEEICEGTYSIDDVVNPSPTFDGKCWSVDFYLSITSSCTSCMIPDKDPEEAPKPRSFVPESFDMSITPNPAINELFVAFDVESNIEGLTIEVYDIQGRLIIAMDRGISYETRIDLSNWNSGVYYLFVKHETAIFERKSFIINK